MAMVILPAMRDLLFLIVHIVEVYTEYVFFVIFCFPKELRVAVVMPDIHIS